MIFYFLALSFFLFLSVCLFSRQGLAIQPKLAYWVPGCHRTANGFHCFSGLEIMLPIIMQKEEENRLVEGKLHED